MGGNPVTGTHQVDAHWEDDGSDAGKATATNGVWFMTVEQADGRAPGATLRISVDGTQVATGIPWPWDGKPIALELPSPSAATPAGPHLHAAADVPPPPTFNSRRTPPGRRRCPSHGDAGDADGQGRRPGRGVRQPAQGGAEASGRRGRCRRGRADRVRHGQPAPQQREPKPKPR